MMMMIFIADTYMTLNSQTLIKTPPNTWLKADKLFPEITGFMIAIQDQVISTNKYMKYILKDLNITDNTRRKCWEKSETIRHITGACCTLTLGDYTCRNSQGANIVRQELAIKCGPSYGKPTPYYKCEPFCARELSKLYSDKSITYQTIHNNRPDVFTLDKTIIEAYLIAIPPVTASRAPLPRSSRNI